MKPPVRSITLSRSDFDYLSSNGFLSPGLREHLRSDTNWRSDVEATLTVPPALAEEFRDAFTEQLAKVGFDGTYELTSEGTLLEDLIDRFQ